MYPIKSIFARQILDSRGNPTVECDVMLDSGIIGRASVPSGASTGKFEALELRDGGGAYMGKGVSHAIKNINTIIARALIGFDASKQTALDKKMIELDGTKNKGKLGANAILAVSLAVARAVANQKKIPLYRYIASLFGNKNPCVLPRPMMNIINGGAHADNELCIQEFMIIPVGAKNESDAIRMGSEIFHHLKIILKKNKFLTNVGDEGGFAPAFSNSVQAFNAIISAIGAAGYTTKKQVSIGLDIAASEFYKNGIYKFEGKLLTSDEMIKIYENWIKKYPIISIEDGLDQGDWGAWQTMTKRLGKKCQIVGDDLFVTNPARLVRGIKMKVANAILIKPNQIGTLTETLQTIKIAQRAGYGVIISHRSGETEDTFIADLAVATNAGQIKTGSLSRTERTAKYNQLIRIQEELASHAKYGL